MSSSILPGPRTTAVLLVVAAVGEVVEALISPITGTSTAADLDAIAAHQGAFTVATVIGVVATVLYAAGFLGLASSAAPRSPRLARVGGWASAAAMLGFMGVRLGEAIELAGVRNGLDHVTLAKAIDDTAANPVGALILVLFLGGAIVGLVSLAFAGWRAGWPKAACVLLGVFQVVDFVAPSHPVPVSHLMLLVALAWISATLWRQSERSAAPAAQPVLA
jgi:hypothetical protein